MESQSHVPTWHSQIVQHLNLQSLDSLGCPSGGYQQVVIDFREIFGFILQPPANQRPGVLQSMGSQSHNWVTEQQRLEKASKLLKLYVPNSFPGSRTLNEFLSLLAQQPCPPARISGKSLTMHYNYLASSGSHLSPGLNWTSLMRPIQPASPVSGALALVLLKISPVNSNMQPGPRMTQLAANYYYPTMACIHEPPPESAIRNFICYHSGRL